MLNKKTSNVVSLLVLGWVAILVAIFFVQRVGFLDINAAILWYTEIGVTLLLPLLIILANSRNRNPQLSKVDLTLQLLFYAVWIALGLTFAFTENGSFLFVLVVALFLLFVILAKAVFGKKSAKQNKASSEVNKTAVLLSLNALTIWVPLGYLVGMTAYIAIAFAGYIDSGLGIIIVYRILAPFFIAGALVATATIVWLVRSYLVARPKGASRKAIVLGSLWVLLSVAYLAVWIWYIMPVVTAFHLL